MKEARTVATIHEGNGHQNDASKGFQVLAVFTVETCNADTRCLLYSHLKNSIWLFHQVVFFFLTCVLVPQTTTFKGCSH